MSASASTWRARWKCRCRLSRLAYQMFSIAQATGQDGYEATGIACNVYDIITGAKK